MMRSRTPFARCLATAFIVGLTALASAGCESDTRKPMDEPLTADDAYEAEVRMREGADGLLREKAGDEPLPPPLHP